MATVTMLLLLIVLLAVLGFGVWIGIALLGVAWLAMELFTTRSPGDSMALTIWGASTAWVLSALPLFIWMGEILLKSKMAEGAFRGLLPWMGRLPGGLLHVNVVGCTIFSAATGSSAATTAMIGRVSLPELAKRNYPRSIALGSLAGAGTLGLLIPPSIMMIVYGVAADVSIGRLFMAGVIPGLLLSGMFMAYVACWSWWNPTKLPPPDEPIPVWERIRASRELIPVLALIIVVLGSIYAGVATPTEAAAIGVVGALSLAAINRTLTVSLVRDSLIAATRLYAMIALILAGSAFLSLAMGFVGLPRSLAEAIGSLGLSPSMLLLALMLFYIVLGCFLDGISLILLTTAVLLPTLHTSGIDLLWFGIFVVLVVEMAQITPPVGFNLFVLQGLTKRPISEIAFAAVPFFFIMIGAVGLIWFFPVLVTFLPNQMR